MLVHTGPALIKSRPMSRKCQIGTSAIYKIGRKEKKKKKLRKKSRARIVRFLLNETLGKHFSRSVILADLSKPTDAELHRY